MKPCYSRTTSAESISKQILFSLRASGELTHSRLLPSSAGKEELFELPLNAPRGAERGGVLPSGAEDARRAPPPQRISQCCLSVSPRWFVCGGAQGPPRCETGWRTRTAVNPVHRPRHGPRSLWTCSAPFNKRAPLRGKLDTRARTHAVLLLSEPASPP